MLVGVDVGVSDSGISVLVDVAVPLSLTMMSTYTSSPKNVPFDVVILQLPW